MYCVLPRTENDKESFLGEGKLKRQSDVQSLKSREVMAGAQIEREIPTVS